MGRIDEGSGGAVIELAPFRVVEGVDEGALAAASDALETEFLARQPGYVGRQLLRAGDGRYLDVVCWADRAAAEAAMSAVHGSAACARYFSAMVPPDPATPNGGVEHLEVVRAYGRAWGG